MNPLIKNWQLSLLGIAILIACLAIFTQGIDLGIDFKGGTLYQIELENPVSNEEITRISQIISQRIDPSGLRDITVAPIGNQFIMIQMSETDPSELERIESRIRQQGKFEATLNGEILFTGDEIKKVGRNEIYYGVASIGENLFEWRLPFTLNETAALRFRDMTFHQCSVVSFSPNGQPVYECEKTYFFLDKPEQLIIIDEDQYYSDQQKLFGGNALLGIPQQTDIEELIQDARVNVIVFDSNININEIIPLSENGVIVSSGVSQNFVNELRDLNIEVTVVASTDGPWVWDVFNAQQVIALTENITNENVSDISQAKVFSDLVISGRRDSVQTAVNDLEELTILLESGSLPTPVRSISKETISPSLGQGFLSNILVMGIIAFLVVAIVIIIRYRTIKLAIPIFIIGASEVLLSLGFIALINRPLDLAAFAGLIAAIGTGVDSEIVITDEILGKKGQTEGSLLNRIKSALFIIMASAFTMIAVMMPIVLFSRNFAGLDKLFGFAVVAMAGAVIGVFITRPAFTKIIEKIAPKIKK